MMNNHNKDGDFSVVRSYQKFQRFSIAKNNIIMNA